MSSNPTYKRLTVSCLECKSEVAKNMFDRHYKSKQCLSGGKFGIRLTSEKLTCIHCSKNCESPRSKASHENLCKSNQNRRVSHFEKLTRSERSELIKDIEKSNQYIKAKKLGLPIPTMKEESKEKIRESTKRHNQEYWFGEKSTEHRKNHSMIMRNIAASNPESYSASNRGRTKQVEKYGIKFQGSWELLAYEYFLTLNISIVRNYTGFQYEFQGKRTYFPDFYLPDKDIYIEVKGYKTEKDAYKWAWFPHKLLVISLYEIGQIKEGKFCAD